MVSRVPGIREGHPGTGISTKLLSVQLSASATKALRTMALSHTQRWETAGNR